VVHVQGVGVDEQHGRHPQDGVPGGGTLVPAQQDDRIAARQGLHEPRPERLQRGHRRHPADPPELLARLGPEQEKVVQIVDGGPACFDRWTCHPSLLERFAACITRGWKDPLPRSAAVSVRPAADGR
jgi:hypothetical protein